MSPANDTGDVACLLISFMVDAPGIPAYLMKGRIQRAEGQALSPCWVGAGIRLRNDGHRSASGTFVRYSPGPASIAERS